MIKLIVVGKIKAAELSRLCDDYQKRINHYHKLAVIEVKDEPISANDSPEHIKDREGVRILEKISSDDHVIALDLCGKMQDSVTFSKTIDKILTSKNIVFVIGGSLGLSDKVKRRADSLLKLSDMTFLHQMTRLIILEQIYRSFKILNNEVYHK